MSTKTEAEAEAKRINDLDGMTAEVVRILPASVDPIVEDDNGWDVEVTIQ